MVRRILISMAVVVSVITGFVALRPVSVSAQGQGADSCSDSILGFPTWFRYLELSGPPECDVIGPRVNPDTGRPATYPSGEFDWQRAAGYVAVAVLEILLRIGSLVAVAFIMYGGFRFITSQGDPEGAKDARNTIINALIGLVITIASATIVAFIANRLTS